MNSPTNYFRKERNVLRAFGLSLSGNENTAYKIYSFLFLTVIYSYPILDIGELFKQDLEVVFNVLVYEFAFFVAMTKGATVFRNHTQLGKILDKLEQEPFAPNPERGGNIEIKLIKKCLWITNVQTVLYWSVTIISVLFGIAYCLRSRLKSNSYEDWTFLFGPFTLLNVTYSPNYEISVFYQFITATSIACHFCTVDLVIAAVLAHLSTQFKILQNNIRRILFNAHNEMLKNTGNRLDFDLQQSIDGSKIPYKFLKKSLEDVVLYHLAIIGVVEEVEKIFSGELLLVFVGTLGTLGLAIYHVSLIPYNNVQFFQSFMEIVGMNMQVLTVCFWGEQLMFESTEVARAAYESNFVGADLRYQKGIALIIRRSQCPSRVTAGRFAEICLSTSTWILRTSYSAFMVLRNRNVGK